MIALPIRGRLLEQQPNLGNVEACQHGMIHRLCAVTIGFGGMDQAFGETVAGFADADIGLPAVAVMTIEPDITAEHAIEIGRLVALLEENVVRVAEENGGAGAQAFGLVVVEPGHEGGLGKYSGLMAVECQRSVHLPVS